MEITTYVESITDTLNLPFGHFSNCMHFVENATFGGQPFREEHAFYIPIYYMPETAGIGRDTIECWITPDSLRISSLYLVECYIDSTVLSINFLKTISPFWSTLQQNYPNPFNPVTNLKFSVPKAGKVTLIIYDIQGCEINRLIDGFHSTGIYQRTFDASGLSSGVYFACLKAEGFSQTRKLLLIK